jgi:hypothetical protein
MNAQITLKSEILAVADGEPIEAINLGEENIYCYEGKDSRDIPEDKLNKILSWEEGAKYLDYTWNSGFGGSDCHFITAWTASKVIYIHEYDGSTTVVYVPRNSTV